MRLKKETKQNAELQQEFAVTRFLWEFATKWHHAKTSNQMDQFWLGVKNSLYHYDKENPEGRRIDNEHSVSNQKASSKLPFVPQPAKYPPTISPSKSKPTPTPAIGSAWKSS